MVRLLAVRRNVDSPRGAPQPFEVVIKPRALAENVNDEPAVIEQNPFGVRASFTVRRAHAVRREPVFDRVGDSFELGLARTGTQQKILCECAEIAQIQHAHVLRLFVLGRFDCPAKLRTKGFPIHR